jgi:RHS repeat-associated protein
MGRIVRKTESIGSAAVTYAYSYDDVDRLSDVQVYLNDNLNPTTWYEFEYDNDAVPVGNGNRTGRTIHMDDDADGVWDSEVSEVGTYDLQDRILSYDNAQYEFTDGGMLATKTEGADVTEYYYDLLGNLKGVDLPDGTSIEYLIDGKGRRIWKQVDEVSVKGFVYRDSLNPLAELNGNGETVAVFIYGTKSNVPDYMLKLETGSWVKYRFATDQVGSVRYVIRESDSAVVQEMVYSPFGVVLSDTNPGFQPFGFAGGLYDGDTGLVRFGARDYDPEVGRWTAKDPILFNGDGPNLYVYVLNDPVNMIDPWGRKSWTNEAKWKALCASAYALEPLCEKLDMTVDKDKDKDRNKNNKCPDKKPKTSLLQDLQELCDGTTRLDDGSECYYDDDGNLKGKGSYNYGDDPLEHMCKDVLPYCKWKQY